MIIGDRLRALREEKKLSQGDIEKRTGLLRCVAGGKRVPATVAAISDSVRWAEEIMSAIDERWPVHTQTVKSGGASK